jgi:acetoin utilization protein AcuB
MKVKQIMKTSPVAVGPEDTLRQAIQRMAWSGGRHLPVTDGERVIGVLSARDVATAQIAAPATVLRVREIMKSPAQTCGPEDSLTEVMGRMASAKIGCLPVTEQGRLVGMITVTDVLFAQVQEAMDPGAETARPS